MITDLQKAILAMDSYNRGYDEGIKLTGDVVGNVTVVSDSEDLGYNGSDRLDQAAGFYAVAYKETGGSDVVIS